MRKKFRALAADAMPAHTNHAGEPVDLEVQPKPLPPMPDDERARWEDIARTRLLAANEREHESLVLAEGARFQERMATRAAAADDARSAEFLRREAELLTRCAAWRHEESEALRALAELGPRVTALTPLCPRRRPRRRAAGAPGRASARAA